MATELSINSSPEASESLKKSQLQTRAEQASNRFRSAARRPVVIKFAGTPKAGKTTVVAQVQAFLRRCGFRVEVVIERASVCPIRDKKHSNFNVWTACTTLAQILEKTQAPPRESDPDVLILDRGIFDAVCWLTMMEGLARITPADRVKIEIFISYGGVAAADRRGNRDDCGRCSCFGTRARPPTRRGHLWLNYEPRSIDKNEAYSSRNKRSTK